MPVYRRTLVYFKPFLAQTAVATLLTLFSIGMNLLKPVPIKYLIDDVLLAPSHGGRFLAAHHLPPVTPETLLLWLCLSLVAIQLLAGVAGMFTSLIFVKVGLQALLKLRTELYAYLQALPLKYHDARRSSDSSFRVAYDSQAIQTIYNKGFSNIFNATITLACTFAVMWRIDRELTLVSLGIIPFIVAAIYFYADRIRSQSTTIQERESAVLAVAQEGLSSIRMVQAFSREEFEVSQFSRQARESLEANLKLTLTSVSSALVIGTLMALGTALMYYVGSRHVLQQVLTLGSLQQFAFYLVALYAPLESLTYTVWAMEGAAAGAQRCFEVLDKEDEVKNAPDAKSLRTAAGAITFENVAFGYDPNRPILRDITLAIQPGETVAFVGGTGAGKTTLLSLVPRFYDPTAGRLLIDGEDLRAVTKRSLRDQISIVLQDTVLFSTTIRENIAYGRPDATEEEIVAAAKRAEAHSFIMEMPDQYRSQVGERGGHLSVGQRQRIGIARAFLKDAPVLLLDEPTSALDPATEHAIMETMKDLMKGRTTLIITHRIATVHGFQRIVVLQNGRIAETGSGAELLARNGPYAALCRAANIE